MMLQLQLTCSQRMWSSSFIVPATSSDGGQLWPNHAIVNPFITSTKLVTLTEYFYLFILVENFKGRALRTLLGCGVTSQKTEFFSHRRENLKSYLLRHEYLNIVHCVASARSTSEPSLGKYPRQNKNYLLKRCFLCGPYRGYISTAAGASESV
jgi:hypothetical protein